MTLALVHQPHLRNLCLVHVYWYFLDPTAAGDEAALARGHFEREPGELCQGCGGKAAPTDCRTGKVRRAVNDI